MLDGLVDDVDHDLRPADQWSVIDVVRMTPRLHAFGHESLGGRVDHAVLLGDQVPGSMSSPSWPGYRLLNALDRYRPLHRRQHLDLSGAGLLSERPRKSIGGQP